jgi:hypothetical protein
MPFRSAEFDDDDVAPQHDRRRLSAGGTGGPPNVGMTLEPGRPGSLQTRRVTATHGDRRWLFDCVIVFEADDDWRLYAEVVDFHRSVETFHVDALRFDPIPVTPDDIAMAAAQWYLRRHREKTLMETRLELHVPTYRSTPGGVPSGYEITLRQHDGRFTGALVRKDGRPCADWVSIAFEHKFGGRRALAWGEEPDDAEWDFWDSSFHTDVMEACEQAVRQYEWTHRPSRKAEPAGDFDELFNGA